MELWYSRRVVNQSLKTAETDALRICMIQRGLTVEKLAADCGVAPITLRNQIAKNFPSLRLRLVVEGVLNLAIWSGAAGLQVRQQLISNCGFDPFVLSASDLQRHVSGFKIRGRSKDRTKRALIALLQIHFQTTKTKPDPHHQ